MDELKKKRVSYSQYSNWYKCPRRFYLDMVKGLRTFEDNLNTCFGTAVHEVVQLYIKKLYTESASAADELDLNRLFKENFNRELSEKNVKYTDDDYTEFVFNAEDILREFCNSKNRIKYFPSNKYEFVEVELELGMPIKNNVEFIAYIDLILKEKSTGRIKIYDFKTSTNGWNQYQKEDQSKLDQLLLYKSFYSKKFNIPLNMIDIEFFILKRKLYEDTAYPQSRLQIVIPPHKNKNIIESINTFSEFVSSCFNEDGDYITDDKYYPKNPGKNKKHCSWCPHYKTNCDGKESKN